MSKNVAYQINIETGVEFPCMLKDTREELEAIAKDDFSRIEEVEFAEMYNGVIYLNEGELKEAKQKCIREIRNQLLSTEIDPVVSNPLRWADMSEEEKKEYSEYRAYLLDYTKQADWQEQEPLSMKEWREQHV